MLSAKLTEGWPLRRSWSIPPSRLRRATVPQFNMVASLRSHRTALRLPGVPWLRTVLRSVCSPLQPFGPPPFAKRTSGLPLLIGLTTACFRHRRRPSCAPLQFPLKSYGFPGAETARKRFLLWKMGFSGAAYCESMHPSIQHGRPTALADSLAALPASLGLLRPASATGGGLRAPPPYTPPGTIEVRKGFAPLLAFSTVWELVPIFLL